MPTSGPFTVSVVANGQVLREHNPPRDETLDEASQQQNRTVKYIEAVEGVEFGIDVKFNKGTVLSTGALGVDVCLDNRCVRSKLLAKHKFEQNSKGKIFINYAKFFSEDKWVARSFVFDKLATTDTDSDSKSLRQIARSVGTIRVRICNMTPAVRSPQVARSTEDNHSPIPEKALKGQPIDLSFKFGSPREVPSRSRYNSHRVGPPLFECVFKYRSKRALQILDIIPLTPDPVSLIERDPETLNLNEARQLISQLQSSRPRTANIKLEKTWIKRESPRSDAFDTAHVRHLKRDARSTELENDDDDVIFVEMKRVKTQPTAEVEVLDLD